MSFIDAIKGKFSESKEKKEKEKSAYQLAYEQEKKLLKEEREKQRIERAKQKAKRDVRNPLYRRMAKKLGASTKQAIDKYAAEIGKQAARKKVESDIIEKSRRKARYSEIAKMAAKQEKARINASPPMGLREKRSPVDLFGSESMNPLGPGSGMDMNPLGESKKGNNMFGNFNPLGTSISSNKKEKKFSLFDGL